MDTSTLKRELDANKREYEIAIQSKRKLAGDVLNTQSKVATYKRDSEAATIKAEKYKNDFDRATAELKTKTEELKTLDDKIAKYTQEISKLEQDFRKMSEEMRRAQTSPANTNSAPSKRRSA